VNDVPRPAPRPKAKHQLPWYEKLWRWPARHPKPVAAGIVTMLGTVSAVADLSRLRAGVYLLLVTAALGALVCASVLIHETPKRREAVVCVLVLAGSAVFATALTVALMHHHRRVDTSTGTSQASFGPIASIAKVISVCDSLQVPVAARAKNSTQNESSVQSTAVASASSSASTASFSAGATNANSASEGATSAGIGSASEQSAGSERQVLKAKAKAKAAKAAHGSSAGDSATTIDTKTITTETKTTSTETRKTTTGGAAGAVSPPSGGSPEGRGVASGTPGAKAGGAAITPPASDPKSSTTAHAGSSGTPLLFSNHASSGGAGAASGSGS
jgi:hypothetical protein